MTFRLQLESRPVASRTMRYVAPVLAAALTLVTGLVLFYALGKSPVEAFKVFFVDPIKDLNGITEWLLKASPLCLIALGLAVGFRANVWNIGAEGQLTMGAAAAGALAVHFDGATGHWLLPAMLVAGLVAGAAWAGIAALLRSRFNANEILVTLMLTYIATFFLGYLVDGPLKDPNGQNFPQSILFGESALFPLLIEGTRLNASTLITLLAIPFVWVLMMRSFVGYQLRVSGLAQDAAVYAGFSRTKAIWMTLLLSGGLAGLAGVGEVAGPIGQLQPSVSPGYGFAAIIVAFVGRLHPVGIVLASLLMSLLYLGGESAQIALQLPNAITGLFQGLLLFFLLGTDVFVNYHLRLVRVSGGQK
ncbi:ABC transporter permease [Leeia oryzae]|uniref:ABC transporter permease n=1 Tax=Leeia oryzae TaxID=356662 RepID=UPI00035FDC73|nr:ABC transporter permease [Leeia oryzae]